MIDPLLSYARDVCMNVGHVRTGVGAMDRCGRCGEPVDDQTMRTSIETSWRRRYDELQDAVREFIAAETIEEINRAASRLSGLVK